jgi:hypothetical protein
MINEHGLELAEIDRVPRALAASSQLLLRFADLGEDRVGTEAFHRD